MACKNGRAKVSSDQDRELFSESAGTCLICNTPLFTAAADRRRSVSIAERAHVVAHSERGPRGDRTRRLPEVDDPSNIVLLCPTCHTTADKDPGAHPVDQLLQMKAARAAAVARVGGVATFDTREKAREAVETILNRNSTIFQLLGPSPSDGAMESSEAAAKWTQTVLEDIVPGNELIVAMVEMNPELATAADRQAAEELRVHTRDLYEKHRDSVITGLALRFPTAAESIFTEES